MSREKSEQYNTFLYDDFEWKWNNNVLLIHFYFSCGEFKFEPKLKITGLTKTEQNIDRFIFNLGMIELISYWKAFASKTIKINYSIDVDFWQNLILKGMGQYYFENKLNFIVPEIIAAENSLPEMRFDNEGFLLGIGGGKDSAVAIEIIQNAKLFALNPIPQSKQLLKNDSVVVERTIDPLLLELNTKGFYNGHTPFSAYLAFLGTMCAALSGKKYFVVANEEDSNEGNTIYLGREINHQYSKTFEFEKSFREYLNTNVTSDISYFSAIRPLSELKVAELFSKLKKYHSQFISCNIAQKSEHPVWCCECPKCLFTFLILSPFLEIDDLVNIFGKNLFEETNLLPILKSLINENEVKPFECVGRRSTSLAAIYLAKKKHGNMPLLSLVEGKEEDYNKYSKEHFLPKEIEESLKKLINEN